MGGIMFVTKVTRIDLAWLRTRVKRTQSPTRRSCKLPASRTNEQCNLYDTATRRSVFSTLTTFQPSVGSFGLNLVSRLRIGLGFRWQPHPRSRSRRDVCSLANCQLGPGEDLADLVDGSFFKRCRSFVLTGDQLYVSLVPPCICTIGWGTWVLRQHFYGH